MQVKNGWLSAMALLAMSSSRCSPGGGIPSAVLRPAELVELPGASVPQENLHGLYDCNNPAHWDGDTMYLFSSIGHPWRGSGPDLFSLKRPSTRVSYDNEPGWTAGGRWIEATYKHASGALYGWYHNEPPGVCEGKGHLTAPRIGALVSQDNGLNWHDLGIVLEAPSDSLACETANRYFAGGNGDFSVILDNKKEYFYFLISTYHKDVAEQGVSVARMCCADRDDPVGKVWKWHEGAWGEPGLAGHVSPIFPATINWHRQDANAFWGPSIHWNTHLGRYVVLLNRAKDKDWAQEGIYLTFNSDLADPRGWTPAAKIYDGRDFDPGKIDWWYPQVAGTDATRHETDKLAGRVARFFIRGKSQWEIVFLRPGEKPPEGEG